MRKIISIDMEDFTIDKINDFKIRDTARAIIFNNKEEIAFINASNYNYHLLPGGGIDDGETREESLKRECLEEAGLNIEIISEIGKTEEIQRYARKIQNSFCYIAKQVGEVKKPKLEENEKKAGYKLEWFSLDKALEILDQEGYANIPGKYAYLRNKAILNEVKKTK